MSWQCNDFEDEGIDSQRTTVVTEPHGNDRKSSLAHREAVPRVDRLHAGAAPNEL
jgi:hypothetical protein